MELDFADHRYLPSRMNNFCFSGECPRVSACLILFSFASRLYSTHSANLSASAGPHVRDGLNTAFRLSHSDPTDLFFLNSATMPHIGNCEIPRANIVQPIAIKEMYIITKKIFSKNVFKCITSDGIWIVPPTIF